MDALLLVLLQTVVRVARDVDSLPYYSLRLTVRASYVSLQESKMQIERPAGN
jgi:hypothetical protein